LNTNPWGHIVDVGPSPDCIEECVLGDKLAWVFHQIAQDGESLPPERDLLGVPPQPLVDQVETKWGEAKVGRWLHVSPLPRVKTN
jgi:hypothetical protein